jgi:hypothetical protein
VLAAGGTPDTGLWANEWISPFGSFGWFGSEFFPKLWLNGTKKDGKFKLSS